MIELRHISNSISWKWKARFHFKQLWDIYKGFKCHGGFQASIIPKLRNNTLQKRNISP